jgi:hypothetical protein
MENDDFENQMEVASLLQGRYYLILNNNEADSFGMTAYDTFEVEDDNDIPAGRVILNGLIELLESDFDRVWDAGQARLSFVDLVEGMKIELEDEDITDKVLEREDNVVKVKFNSEQ